MLKMDRIPLLFEAQLRPDNGGFPQSFPFDVRYDPSLCMYRQTSTPELRKLLEAIYATGSMLSCGMDGGAGKIRADASLEYALRHRAVAGKRILELGCGNGYLLRQFQLAGAEVVGLEPGPQGHEAHQHPGLTVIQDFFPSPRVQGRFDLVMHFNVLEHIEDPEKFLVAQRDILNPGGAILCGFPHCEPCMEQGDVSIFVHEHFSYFTRTSIQRLATRCGLTLLDTATGAGGGMLFAYLVPTGEANDPGTVYPILTEDRFNALAGKLQDAVTRFASDIDPGEVAIYCPMRALNALFMAGISGCRLIDDNEALHGKYLPCMQRPIENFSDLTAHPPRRLLIFSRSFGALLRARCEAAPELTSTLIRSIEDLDRESEAS